MLQLKRIGQESLVVLCDTKKFPGILKTFPANSGGNKEKYLPLFLLRIIKMKKSRENGAL